MQVRLDIFFVQILGEDQKKCFWDQVSQNAFFREGTNFNSGVLILYGETRAPHSSYNYSTA